MQPYFLPYIGYFQLIAAVDRFVVYDRIKYTKKGWINRNRLLADGRDLTFSLPLKAASDGLDVVERELAPNFDRRKLLNQFAGAYRRAPQFEPTYALLESVINHPTDNLFDYLRHSLTAVCAHLQIHTPLTVSSSLAFDNALKGSEKVLAICAAIGADHYLNPIGGTDLYDKAAFAAKGVHLQFLKARPIEYPQLGAPFVPWLSIVDVMMFNPVPTIARAYLPSRDLI